MASQARLGSPAQTSSAATTDRRADYELLRGRLDTAFTGLSLWGPFTIEAHAVGSRRLSDWLATTGTVL